MPTAQNKQGFTLLEILIALFIFSILSLILSTALRNVIDVEARTEKKAERVHQLQIALLLLSRDVEQAVNRPIASEAEKEEPAFEGRAQGFTLTHGGFANPLGKLPRSFLSRTRYQWDESTLWRLSWPVLDQAPDTKPHARPLLTNVFNATFSYLDEQGRFHREWPVQNTETPQALPKAVKLEMSLSGWGKISGLYVIPTQNSKLLPPQSPPPKP